jgi:hypothetical protein
MNYTPLKIMLKSEHEKNIISLFIGMVVCEVLGYILYKNWPQIKNGLDIYITLILQLLKYGNYLSGTRTKKTPSYGIMAPGGNRL